MRLKNDCLQLATQNSRRFFLITLLAIFLIYCAYTTSTCFSKQMRRGRTLIGQVFVAERSQNATLIPPHHSPPVHRTRTCANELNHYSSSRAEEDDMSLKGEGIKNGNRRLPSALIIGVKKSGTRALLEFIRFHPDVRASGCEVHFFDRHYKKGLRWYRHRMPVTRDGQITMEKTPSYFITREVPKRVYNMNPKTKLLLVVRDPVTRAISDYTQAITKLMTTRRFEELAFVNGSKGERKGNYKLN